MRLLTPCLSPKNVTDERPMDSHSVVGMVECTGISRVKEKKQRKMGRYGNQQWNSKKSVGSLARNGEVQLQMWKIFFEHQ